MLEQKTSIEVGANQSSTQRGRPMPPCECADKISSTASAEFSDSKVHNVVTQSRAVNRRPRSRDRSISSAIPGASVQCLAALSPSAGFGASPGFRTVLNNIQPRLMPWGELQLSCSIMPTFATDLLVLYTRAHDYLPNSRSSVSTASRRKRPDADCRSDYTSRLLRDR